MSGEALKSTHRRPSAVAAIEDCVRGRARMVPRRTPRQLAQLQFHCGKPPPAALPSTRTLIKLGRKDPNDPSPPAPLPKGRGALEGTAGLAHGRAQNEPGAVAELSAVAPGVGILPGQRRSGD